MTSAPLRHMPAESGEQVAAPSRLRPIASLACVVAIALAANAGALRNDFAMDDNGIIKRDDAIRSLAQIPSLFGRDYWAPTMIAGLYRPFVKISFALNYAAGGLDPSGYQLVNLVLHASVTALVWLLFRRLTESLALATAAAALFGVHAVHTEVTANVAYGRPELMGALLFLAVLLLHTRRATASRARERLLYGAGLLCYAAALLSKESVVTLLGVMPLWDLCFRSDPARSIRERVAAVLRQHAARYAGYVAVTLAYIGLREIALGSGRTLPPEIAIDNPLFGLPVGWRISNAFWVSLQYARLLLAPLHLSYDYSYDQIQTFQVLGDPRPWIGIGAWAVLLAGWWWSFRRSPRTFFALGLVLATFSVVSNIVVPIGTILGERLLYAPSIGFCFLVALVVHDATRRLPQRTLAFAALMGCLVALHAARSVQRIPDWVDQWTLFVRDVERSPSSTKAHSNAGAALLHAKRYEEGLVHLRRAIEIQPYGYAVPWATAGLAYTTLGRDDEAREMYEGAVRNGTKEPAVFNNLGFLLVDREIDVARGLALLEEAASTWPDDPEVLDSLGWAYYKVGRVREARDKLVRAVGLPGTADELALRRQHLQEIEDVLRAPAAEHTGTLAP